MEKLVNCNIVIDIELIELISGGNQDFEVVFSTKDKERYKIVFTFVWDMRYTIENGCIDRFYRFERDCRQNSSIVSVENSSYIKYFEQQVSGTRPIQDVKDYIIFDAIDTVLEVLTPVEPVLVKLTQDEGQ